MIKSVSRNCPCPICGHTDWCGIMSTDNGAEMYVCQRNTDNLLPYKGGVIGTDGKYYICVGISKEGKNNIFRDAAEVAEEQTMQKETWKAAHTADRPVRTLTPVDPVEVLSNDRLDKIYRRLLELLILEPEHKEYLHREGWTDGLMDDHMIRSFPEEDYIRFKKKQNGYKSGNNWRKSAAKTLVAEFGTLRGVPGAYQNRSGEWTFYGRPGILFPVYDANGYIYRLRIRLDKPPASGGKYRNFSSFIQDEEAEKQGFLVNKLCGGCQAGNQIGFYMNRSRDDMFIAYITEGEKKGIIGEYSLKAPVVSLPGVNSYGKLLEGKAGERPVDYLKVFGVRILIIAYDADKHTNARVMQSQIRTIETLHAEGFQIGLAEWDGAYGKGLDDLLMNGKRPRYVLA